MVFSALGAAVRLQRGLQSLSISSQIGMHEHAAIDLPHESVRSSCQRGTGCLASFSHQAAQWRSSRWFNIRRSTWWWVRGERESALTIMTTMVRLLGSSWQLPGLSPSGPWAAWTAAYQRQAALSKLSKQACARAWLVRTLFVNRPLQDSHHYALFSSAAHEGEQPSGHLSAFPEIMRSAWRRTFSRHCTSKHSPHACVPTLTFIIYYYYYFMTAATVADSPKNTHAQGQAQAQAAATVASDLNSANYVFKIAVVLCVKSAAAIQEERQPEGSLAVGSRGEPRR